MNEELVNRIGKSGLIIFDGSCGACSAFIGGKKDFFKKYGFEVAPLQEEGIPALTGASEEALLQAIHLYTPEGKLFRGIEFFRYLSGKVWWLIPISLLLRTAFLRPVFEKIYEMIAKHRKTISKVCRLESRALYK